MALHIVLVRKLDLGSVGSNMFAIDPLLSPVPLLLATAAL